MDRPGLRMARIAIPPTWVGVPDFVTRLPGGSSAAGFDARGSSWRLGAAGVPRDTQGEAPEK
ncbi:MAG: hypothetical protein HOU01_15160 [Streptomycetaceae bacterium]|nr:hypothetical protein [Streptomycetaceae bacterium]